MKNNQNGFGILGIIAIIVVITGIGLAGWYVWSRNANQRGDNTQAAPGDQKNRSIKNEGEETQESLKTVALGSLGLAFTPPADLRDIILTEGVNESGEPFVAFSTPGLKSLETNTYCDLLGASRLEAPYHLGLVFRIEGSSVESVDGRMVVKQYNDYAVVYRKPADNCFVDATNQARSNQLMNKLYTSLSETISED